MIVLLLAVIIGGCLVVWARYQPASPLEISLPADIEAYGDILIDGAVTNPGYYPFSDSDSLESLIRAAGGTTNDADLTNLELYIMETGAGSGPQKIDINRAEVWLLDALPGIGPSREQAIVDYRQEHGLFRSIDEIKNINGIGTAVYEQIEPLIMVSEQ